MSEARSGGRPAEILMVEDNPGDVVLAIEALKEGKLLNRVSVVRDGVEAMSYLRRRGQFEKAPRPDLVLLDLNLPKKDGREVLSEMKADADLRRIPVVILTSSKAEEDVLRSYDQQASCYITKPVELEQFMSVVRSIERFWFSVVTLPTTE
jgi:CheY-like chemotaxis protein